MRGRSLPSRIAPHIERVREYLERRGVAVYLVGGVVRDLLLGREVHDIDLAVAADPSSVVNELRERLGGYYVPLDEERGIIRLVLPEKDFFLDFSELKGDIEKDLGRRDFTIDALALTPDGGALIDPFGGEKDLRAGIIRALHEDVFRQDPGRLLRAVRLAVELGFVLEAETRRLITIYRELLLQVSGERVREEILRTLSLKGAYRGVRLLEELGLLTLVFPELDATRGVGQPPEHFGDVFAHAL